MEEKEVLLSEEEEASNVNNEKGFSMTYNLTLVSAVATVAMFVVGTALYLTIVTG